MSKTNQGSQDLDAKEEKQNKNTKIDDLELNSVEEINDSVDKSMDEVVVNKAKVVLLKKLLLSATDTNRNLLDILSSIISSEDEQRISIGQMEEEGFIARTKDGSEKAGGRIVEGVFDGENMIGPDGKQYSVPANYASKSKLVEGDILKLTITSNGTFLYKQIGPIERIRVVGNLEQNPNGNFFVVGDKKKWNVLTASVTYFKGELGDEVIILVPKTGESKWAAVENIVRKK